MGQEKGIAIDGKLGEDESMDWSSLASGENGRDKQSCLYVCLPNGHSAKE